METGPGQRPTFVMNTVFGKQQKSPVFGFHLLTGGVTADAAECK